MENPLPMRIQEIGAMLSSLSGTIVEWKAKGRVYPTRLEKGASVLEVSLYVARKTNNIKFFHKLTKNGEEVPTDGLMEAVRELAKQESPVVSGEDQSAPSASQRTPQQSRMGVIMRN